MEWLLTINGCYYFTSKILINIKPTQLCSKTEHPHMTRGSKGPAIRPRGFWWWLGLLNTEGGWWQNNVETELRSVRVCLCDCGEPLARYWFTLHTFTSHLLIFSGLCPSFSSLTRAQISQTVTLRCVIPVVCVTSGREENVFKQHN